MLRVAGELTAQIPNVRVLPGSSDDLAGLVGPFRLVTMGRSFHWMDRPETLRRLDRLIEPGGAVGVFGDTHPDLPDNAWRASWRAALQRNGGERPASHTHEAGWTRHEAILLDSAFSQLDYIAAVERRSIPVGTLVERALSMSSMAQVGERATALAQDIAESVAPWLERGHLTEVVESYAYLAWRPAEAPA
jgi:hypothetical protein